MLRDETASLRWSSIRSTKAICLIPSLTRHWATARPIPEPAPEGCQFEGSDSVTIQGLDRPVMKATL